MSCLPCTSFQQVQYFFYHFWSFRFIKCSVPGGHVQVQGCADVLLEIQVQNCSYWTIQFLYHCKERKILPPSMKPATQQLSDWWTFPTISFTKQSWTKWSPSIWFVTVEMPSFCTLWSRRRWGPLQHMKCATASFVYSAHKVQPHMHGQWGSLWKVRCSYRVLPMET